MRNLIQTKSDATKPNFCVVLNSYMLCCLYNVGGRAYDDIEYLDPCDLYNDGMYEYQQVQSVYDSDWHEEKYY